MSYKEDAADNDEPHLTWPGIFFTGLVSLLTGIIFYGFFYYQRRGGTKASDIYYQVRKQHWNHRTPTVVAGKDYWWKAALDVSEDELLRCVGLDGYMFLRFLKLGFYLCSVGTLIALILIPIYATTEGIPKTTFQFDRLTLALVESSPSSGTHEDGRLWIAVAAWYVFVAITHRAFHEEWILYRRNYLEFCVRGDIDMPQEYRYAVRVEAIPPEHRTQQALWEYFERLFPQNVLATSLFWETPTLTALIKKRKETIKKVERMVATLQAKPDKPRPTVRVDGETRRGVGLLTNVTSKVAGSKQLVEVDAIEYYTNEIQRLNQTIDIKRELLQQQIRDWNGQNDDVLEEDQVPDALATEETIGGMGTTSIDESATTGVSSASFRGFQKKNNQVTSTAHVTFTSLRSKQAAIQCELNGDPDSMIVVAAPDPDGVLWDNVGVTLGRQRLATKQAAILFTVGVMFWTIPVAFVTSIAELNGIMEAFGFDKFDDKNPLYGIIAGVLPPLFLAGFMWLLYKVIEATALKFVRFKSMTEVVTYTMKWNLLFNFANLWYIVIGGSFFDELDKFLNLGPTEFSSIMAHAMAGMASFFINMIQVHAFALLGLELSLIPAYGLRLVMRLVQNPDLLTQREIDDAMTPPTIEWGRVLPTIVFIFLVILVYMPIVPVMEVFGMVYFGLHYVVFKHQCLHVYAQNFEGGGTATWQQLFPFLIASLFMGEVTFVGYMGIKEATPQSVVAIGPLIATIFFHRRLQHTIIKPLRHLPLEIAANVDIEDGELEHDAKESYSLYGMPVLKTGDDEEREPLPYRRDQGRADATTEGGAGSTEDQYETEILDDSGN